ncbi:MAG: hypothetical protein PHN72_01510 [Bacilli bacterium]|nr:hypothetical protein [Bacilli bacterium]
MKKITTLFFLFILYLSLNKTNIVKPVASIEENKDDYFFCYTNFENKKITTKNFMTYFKEMEIVWIEPAINPLYEKQSLKKINPYMFTADTNENNIERFQKEYQKTFYNMGFTKEANQVYIEGIPIHSAKIVCNNEIYNTLKKITNEIVQRGN